MADEHRPTLAEETAAIEARTASILADVRRRIDSGQPPTYQPTEGAAVERAEFEKLTGEPW